MISKVNAKRPHSLWVRNLRVDFPQLIAVQQFSLALKAGDICGLIGPNGAGKTSTFKAMVGLLRPTQGEIKVMGHSLSQEPEKFKSQISYMPDDTPLYEDLLVEEYLQHFALAYGLQHASPESSSMADRIRSCLELTRLQDKQSSLCSSLSRGMRQRLILAKCLLHDPQVLLLDEPASGLDPNGRIELRKLLTGLAAQGKTIVISSHILAELSEFCNQVAIMEKGRLIQGGGLQEIASQRSEVVIFLKWRNPAEQVKEVLNKVSKIQFLEFGPYQARLLFEGDEDQRDQLLKHLIKKDIRLVEWREASADLEQIYLDSEAQEVT